MARALASIINVLDPDVIVLGGGMSNIERLYERAEVVDAARLRGGARSRSAFALDSCALVTATPAASEAPHGSGATR